MCKVSTADPWCWSLGLYSCFFCHHPSSFSDSPNLSFSSFFFFFNLLICTVCPWVFVQYLIASHSQLVPWPGFLCSYLDVYEYVHYHMHIQITISDSPQKSWFVSPCTSPKTLLSGVAPWWMGCCQLGLLSGESQHTNSIDSCLALCSRILHVLTSG